jgi:signal peptidase I
MAMTSDEQRMPDRGMTQAAGDNGPGGNAGGPPASDAAGRTPAAPAARDDDMTAPGGPAAAEEETAGGEAGGSPDVPPAKRRSFWRELPVLVVIALVIALVIKTFVVQAFFIPSSSMENTLLIGDKVLVNKLVYHFRKIQPGDIVVFSGEGSWDPVTPPAPQSSDPVVRLYDATLRPLLHSITGLFGTVPGQTDYIKRVIGVPGDRVACCNAQGLVTVNGVALHEQSYLYPGAEPSELRFSVTVPAGRLWVMGDNRLVSDDSRLHRSDPGNGTIPENKVIGRAFMIVWPPSRWRILPIPSTFAQPGIAAAASASAAASAAVAGGVPVSASSPYLPLAAGFVGAVPLTWLQRRVRLRARRRLRHRRLRHR